MMFPLKAIIAGVPELKTTFSGMVQEGGATPTIVAALNVILVDPLQAPEASVVHKNTGAKLSSSYHNPVLAGPPLTVTMTTIVIGISTMGEAIGKGEAGIEHIPVPLVP